MTRDLLIEDDAVPVVDEREFPSVWHQGEQQLAVSYRFEPGAEDDGVTVRIPLPLLPAIRSVGFDWLVPGLRVELIAALLKTLPKPIRRNVVPANDWARKFADEIPHDPDVDAVPLVEFLAGRIRSMTYTPVDVEDFELDRLPDHLRVTFAVVADRGQIVARSKDLSSLRLKLANRTRASVAKATSTPRAAERNPIERVGLTAWDFDELPRTLDTKHSGGVIRAYPALVDRGSSVDIRLLSTAADQARAHRGGVRRLLQLAIPSPTTYVQEHLTAAEKLNLAASPYRSTADLFDDCLAACIDGVVDTSDLFTKQQFAAARDSVNSDIVDAMFRAVSEVARVLAAAREADKAISLASNIALMAPLADARQQLDALVHPGFVSRAGLTQLRRLPVYLQGIVHRVSKLAENVGRDRSWSMDVTEATARYISAGGELPLHPDAPEHLRHARWMLEELRLGLFAQHLPTAEPVSLQRITKVLGGG
jgi:ATP-dependent helicase HrpA